MGTSTLDSNQRRKILREVASGERAVAYDVVARIALDEINELDKLLKDYKDITVTHNPMKGVLSK